MAKKWDLFKDFFHSEKASGFVLIGCTLISLIIANSGLGENYVHLWHKHFNIPWLDLDLSYSHWVNDGLMAIFFLLVGLEIERELYVGELADFKNALLPVLAAIGGMIIPALLHFFFNAGTNTVDGYGIPMATDIAFALGILSLAGNAVPVSLKIFLTALAIIDDLGAITVIALFYTKSFHLYYFLGAIAVFLILFILGKKKVYLMPIYITGGIIMWYLMLKSGVHATISGVLLAFAIPFHREDDKNSSYHLQHILHKPVAFIILPIFALANTAIIFPGNMLQSLTNNNSIGIITGLLLGKFLGIFLFSFLAVKVKLATLSNDINWRQLAGVACLGGIGFTMSIFITNLAFTDQVIITDSKISILVASLLASVVGLVILKSTGKNK
jgi:NhaA family Na+:H+ antiporter